MLPQIPLFQLAFTAEDRQAVDAVLASGWITSGPQVTAFEQAFAEALGAPDHHVVGLGSCTAALHLALLAHGVGPGDEVVVPALTFVAASNVVRAVGATPVFADIVSLAEPNLCPESVRRVSTERTRAIVLVHYAGYPARVPALRAVARHLGAALLEDSAHACVTQTPEGACGTLADGGAFSFFSNKNLAVGEGGALVLPPERGDLADEVRLLASHGMTTRTLDRHRGHAHTYDVTRPGFNYRWDELRAALARSRLARLPDELTLRAGLAARYRELLAERSPDVTVPFAAPGFARVPAHVFPILLPPGADRAQVMTSMRASGVQTSVHYPLIPAFAAYRASGPDAEPPRGEWDRAADYCARVLTLPLFPALGAADQVRVVDALTAASRAPVARVDA